MLLFIQLAIVLAMIFIGARVGSIGLGMYGMVGVFILVFVFGLEPGNIPIDVMLIIVAVITASAALQAAGGLDYMVEAAARFLRRHPNHITFYGPLVTWLFCLLAGTAHTCYALLPIISEISLKAKIRPERPLSVATISASLGITGSPVSAATAAILSQSLLGAEGIGMREIFMVTIPASLIAILAASFVQNFVGKPLEEDPEYQRRLREGLLEDKVREGEKEINPRAKWAVLAFLLGVALVVLFGSFPALRPSFNGEPVSMNATIEMTMMSIAALILLVSKAEVKKAVKGNVFSSGMTALVSIFGVAWMGSTFFEGVPGGAGHGHSAAGAAGPVPRRERIFLPPELPHRGGRHRLRPHRHHPDRQIRGQPFLPAGRFHHHLCLDRGGVPARSNRINH